MKDFSACNCEFALLRWDSAAGLVLCAGHIATED